MNLTVARLRQAAFGQTPTTRTFASDLNFALNNLRDNPGAHKEVRDFAPRERDRDARQWRQRAGCGPAGPAVAPCRSRDADAWRAAQASRSRSRFRLGQNQRSRPERPRRALGRRPAALLRGRPNADVQTRAQIRLLEQTVSERARARARAHTLARSKNEICLRDARLDATRRRRFGTDYAEVNLERIQYWIDSGRLDAAKPITMRSLMDSGLVKRNRMQHGVKLLSTVRRRARARSSLSVCLSLLCLSLSLTLSLSRARACRSRKQGAELLRTPITVELSDASKKAVEAVESVGGKVVKVYYTRLGLRVHLMPEKFADRLLPRFAMVPPALAEKGVVHPDDAPSAALRRALDDDK